MNYKIIPTPPFEKELKQLAKKHPSIKDEIRELVSTLSQHPQTGTPLGKNCYKIRVAIRSKGRGKSGGARVITFVQIIHKNVFLLSIYDKADAENISEKELNDRIRGLTE
jgi:hypothetical protein